MDPGWFGVMNVWTLLVPAALFFFGAGMLFPLATSGAMEPFPFWQVPLAHWLAACKTLVPAYWRRSLRCCRKPARKSGAVDDLNGVIDCALLAAAGNADITPGQAV